MPEGHLETNVQFGNVKVDNNTFDKEIQERQFIKIRLRLNVFDPE